MGVMMRIWICCHFRSPGTVRPLLRLRCFLESITLEIHPRGVGGNSPRGILKGEICYCFHFATLLFPTAGRSLDALQRARPIVHAEPSAKSRNDNTGERELKRNPHKPIKA